VKLLAAILVILSAAKDLWSFDLDAALKRFEEAKVGQPPDIRAWMDRAEGCWHFAGEEGYDAARRAEIARAIAELRCAQLKADEQALRAKYASEPGTLEGLDAGLALN
jgi:hypothetical protein